MTSIKTICICGAGTMGSGIAQVTATAGFATVLFDVQTETLEKAKTKIEADLKKLVEKKILAPNEDATIMQRIKFADNINDCKADLVIEAIVEKPEAKLWLLQQLTALNEASCIYASNTSSLSLTNMAQNLTCKENFIGLHFFNPAPLMKLVEVVETVFTSKDVIQQVLSFANALNKVPVLCIDAPGFIVNRVARPYYLEALRLAEEKKATYKTIDNILEAQGFKMGPFKLMDLIGNDINYTVSCSVYEQLNKPERLKPSAIQKEKVEKGELGKKSGKGYYDYK